jgi:hypothetical protein
MQLNQKKEGEVAMMMQNIEVWLTFTFFRQVPPLLFLCNFG